MILKATISCSCGCTYEIVSNRSHKSISCPNCNKQFSESDKLIQILNACDNIKLNDENASDGIFHREDLNLETVSLMDECKY